MHQCTTLLKEVIHAKIEMKPAKIACRRPKTQKTTFLAFMVSLWTIRLWDNKNAGDIGLLFF